MLLLQIQKKSFNGGRYRGTYICGVLIFERVLIFKNFLLIVSVGIYSGLVLVFNGYLYSRVYGRCGQQKSQSATLSILI